MQAYYKALGIEAVDASSAWDALQAADKLKDVDDVKEVGRLFLQCDSVRTC